MKTIRHLLVFMLTVSATVVFGQDTKLKGAWQTGDDTKKSMIVTDEFFSEAVYTDKEFISTAGGRWKMDGKNLALTYEFNTAKPDLVGQDVSIPAEIKKGKLTLTRDGKGETWTRTDDGGPGKLEGAWLITGRVRDGEMRTSTPGARRTMKILSGTRFQWIAYNVETKEFSGTGGGTYTTENGKYTEKIEFFSRDNSRVGASLEFDFAIEDGNWRHRGKSSRGEPLDEVWTKREKIGI